MRLLKSNNLSYYIKGNIGQSNAEIKENPKRCWALSETIDVIVKYIGEHMPIPNFGICHGARNGAEVAFFRNKLKMDVIGTELSTWVANQFEHVIVWDFHAIKKEWVDNVDFIYSNSLDHSYNPEYCISQWMKCLKSHGLCFIEWTEAHNLKTSVSSPFAASKSEYQAIFSKSHKVQDILELFFPKLNELDKRKNTTIFVLCKNKC